MLGCVRKQVNRGCLHDVCGSDEKPSRILFPNQDLFLAQKIEVSVSAWTRIDDGGKVPGKIVGVTGGVT
jgi:hypothetical protein